MLWLDFFQVLFISLVERKFNPIIEQRKCKGHEKRDRILVPKVEFNFQISKRNKKIYLPMQFSQIGLNLSNGVNHKLFLKFKELEGHLLLNLKFEN